MHSNRQVGNMEKEKLQSNGRKSCGGCMFTRSLIHSLTYSFALLAAYLLRHVVKVSV